jgi:pSer/pThr/pTyr-binding forkhead associated (FHA) protein
VAGSPERAGLVDQWGRVHTLNVVTQIRRQVVKNCLAIAEPSVSRSHAELRHLGADLWELRDLGSSNGTNVNGKRVDVVRLENGDLVSFGHVAFIFVVDAHSNRGTNQATTTVKPEAPPRIVYDDEAVEETFSGLRPVELHLVTPSGGGGGVLEIDGRAVQLTLIQLELFQVLWQRMSAEIGTDERVRGYVRSSEPLATLAWDTPKPDDNHMKQLVRRVRRTLSRAGIPDIIESRHGFGYRLSVAPRPKPD